MALFNNKEFEALQAENTKLNDKITSLETRLSARDRALSEYKDMVEELEKQIEHLKTENKKYKLQLSDSFSSHKVKNVCQLYDEQIAKFEEEIAALQIRPHNERGAGRKRKATPAQTEMILSLVNQGKSYYSIAKILSTEYNEPWNRTTIRNLVIALQK